MAPVSRRTRCVVFRVTDEEYDSLKSACAARGGRSLSDYTRSELLVGKQAASADRLIWQRFLEVERKLNELYELTKQVFEGIDEKSKQTP